jgi:hypothetical protein
MNNKKTGDAAFPRMSHTNCYEVMLPEQDGMTLRDYFAAKAMQGLAESFDRVAESRDVTANYLAIRSYEIADAMLKAREI